MSLRPVTDRSPVARAWAVLSAVALVATGLVVGALPAQADTSPPAGLPPTVAADSLPTVQIDGVVWQQAMSGNWVYAGGRVGRPARGARPQAAGPAPSKSTVVTVGS